VLGELLGVLGLGFAEQHETFAADDHMEALNRSTKAFHIFQLQEGVAGCDSH
jgi:hypothetical protein